MKIYLKRQPRAKTGRYTSKFRGSTVTAHTYIALFWLVFLLTLLVFGLIRRYQNSQPLISPAPKEEVIQEQSAAPSVVIPCEDAVGYIRCKYYKHEITEGEAKLLIAIAKAESGLNPRAKNRTSSARGLFQIIASTWYQYDCTGDKYDFKDSTDCAVNILRVSGPTQWEVYNNGSYKAFINSVEI